MSNKEKKVWQYDMPNHKPGEGWAKVMLREDGFFSAVSDYGNYSYMWFAHGEDDFRKFFLRVDWDYIVRKLNPERITNSVESFKNVKNALLELRRAGGMSKEKAREALEHIQQFNGRDWDEFVRDPDTYDYFPEAWEFTVTEYHADVVAFAKIIVCRRLRALIQIELDCEADEAKLRSGT